MPELFICPVLIFVSSNSSPYPSLQIYVNELNENVQMLGKLKLYNSSSLIGNVLIIFLV